MKTFNFPRLITSISLIAVLLVACSKDNNNNTGGGGGGGGSNPNTVRMSGSTFSPNSINISTNTTVTFVNDDVMTHTVTENSGAFDSGNIPPGGTYTRTFTTIGTFNYHCNIHSGMTGSVIVLGR